MYFNEHAEVLIFGGSGCVEPLRERQTIYRVNAIEKTSCARGFIALQVTDQVPGGFEIGERRKLTFEFLDTIFAEVAQASFVGRGNRARRVGFCYRDNRDFLGTTAGALRSAGDALPNSGEIRGNRRFNVSHFAILACR
jgi:hypothetical protein